MSFGEKIDAMLKSNAREGEILSSHAAMENNRHNLDRATVDDFGREWQRFDQSSVSSGEVRRRFAEYFSLFPWDSLPRNAVGFDAGCGSGRWAALVAPRVGRLYCIDASAGALSVAQKSLSGLSNVEFYAAPLEAMQRAGVVQLSEPRRVGFDQVHEFPRNGSFRNPVQQGSERRCREQAFQKTAHSAAGPDIDTNHFQ